MLKVNFNPFPELITSRLLLRRITTSDAKEIFFLRSDESVMKYIDREKEKSEEETIAHINRLETMINENSGLVWAIVLKNNPSLLIGSICLWKFQLEHYRAEIGYVLHPDFWRKGYMKEAINSVVRYSFDQLNFHSLEAMINPENLASAGVLEAVGFQREAFLKENYFFRGKFLDTAIYSLLNQPVA